MNLAAPPSRFPIPDLKTGCDVLASLPLANPQRAIVGLIAFLDSLLALPPDGDIYFRLLENTRVATGFITEELGKRYLNKPLPLGDIEENLFQQVVSLWLKTANAYAHCAQSDDRDKRIDDLHTATFLHRCIHSTGMAIIEHQRARREYPWGLWLDLHGYYASAEEWNVANLRVSDGLDPLIRNTHCTAAYISFLLCEMAGCFSLSIREQMLVRRWAGLWAPLVSLHRAEPGDLLPTQVIDLMQDTALRPLKDCLQTEHIRRIDTSRLATQITQTRQKLGQHIPPTELALGDDYSSSQCSVLLDFLARPWSQGRAARKFHRRASSGITLVCSGFEEMHYYMSGKQFEQPENVRIYSRREFESLFSFRHQEDPQQTLQIHQDQLPFNVDTWEVLNESANGFRLVRSTSGRKMLHGQLIALYPHGGTQYLLARTAWLMQEKSGGLIAGIETLPGMPLATAARVQEQGNELGGKYHPVFLLPAVPSISPEQSLVLPLGWYRAGRVLELYTDKAWQIRLGIVLDDGPDFERVNFTLC